MSDIIDILPDAYIKGIRTIEQTIKINRCPFYENSIYLRWLNSLGGIDQELFEKVNKQVPEVSTINKYDQTFSNIRTGDKLKVTEKSYRNNLIAFNTFAKVNKAGFEDMLKSECIEYYREDGLWEKVDVEKEGWENDNDKYYGKIIIKIIFARNER